MKLLVLGETTFAGAPLVDGIGFGPEREAELLTAWHAR
mgnify:CR=1 FL=1